MKQITLVFIVLSLLCSVELLAQRDKDKVDLILGVKPSLASIPRTEKKLSNVLAGGQLGVMFHARKKEIVFPAWSVGVYGTFLPAPADIPDVKTNNVPVEQGKMNLRDAGIYCELIPFKLGSAELFEEKSPQFFVSTPIYWGLLSEVRIYDHNLLTKENALIERSNFMKIEPGVNLNLALSKFAILSGGVSYQWTYLWDKPLENIQEWPDMGMLKLNLTISVRISLFN